MNKKLEVTVDGERIGNVDINRTKNGLQITSDVILSNGTYLFTEDEIKKLIENKINAQYPNRKIEINYKD